MTRMVEAMRRQVERAAAGARLAFRGLLTSLQLRPKVQLASGEGLAGEQLDRVELMQQFGFTSAPPAGTQLIVLPLGGRSSAAVIVATEHGAYRFQLDQAGEACLYNQWGDFVHLRADRTIHMVSQAKVLIETDKVQINAASSVTITTPQFTVDASGGVALNTPTVAASHNVTAGANITADGEVADAGGAKTMSGMRAVYNGHKHPENNVSGGSTNTPSAAM
ncbi:phage baseplate assembly protein V [Roseateles sp. SL47]|uniref:phage baseplate assembly protein V n=1 Tax=Roseateles sp. SL47 TaxID=2995138 RepID=UPI00226EFE22|nr:phage baseplate assembly protein V [Roseateles sp. SL47]WAC71112.1 phage baseplate assembly protein V [Roseateles sp. SL47]